MGNRESELDSRYAALDAGIGDAYGLFGALRSDNGDNAAFLYLCKYHFLVHDIHPFSKKFIRMSFERTKNHVSFY